MATLGISKQVHRLWDPRRGNSSNDWSDPDDFVGPDTVRYYVDASAADDTANGLTDSTPKKTLAAVMALARAGQISVPGRPDQVLLKRGETWTDQVFGYLTTNNLNGGPSISGRSTTQRFVIGTYGSGVRPKIQTGALQGPAILSGANSPSNIAILGLDFDSYLYPAGNGSDTAIDWAGGASHLLIEDCLFREQMQTPIEFTKPGGSVAQVNVVIRRNVFESILGQSGNWIRLGRNEGLLIEQNHFDGRDAISWSFYTDYVGGGIQGDLECRSTGVIIQGNTFSNFGTHAIYMPCGAIVRDNVIISGAHGIQVGNHYVSPAPGFWARPGGVECQVIGNYIANLKDVGSQLGNFYLGGRGIRVENSAEEGEVLDNILAHNAGSYPYAIEIDGSGLTATGVPTPVLGLICKRNKIYKWWHTPNPYHFKGFVVYGYNYAGQPQDIADLVFADNDIQEILANVSLLVHIADPSLTSEVRSARNRFWRIGSFNDRYSPAGFGSTNLAGYLAALGETSSIEFQVPYPDADKMISHYAGSIGLTATEAAMVAAWRAQTRFTTGGASGWRDDLMAEVILENYIRPNYLA